MTTELKEQARANVLFEQDLRAKFDHAKQQRIETELFPAKEIDEDWFTQAKKNLRFASLMQIGLPVDEFEKVVNCNNPKKLTLGHVGALCNLFQNVSAEQMNVLVSQYIKLQRINTKIAMRWNEIVDTINNELTEKFEQEMIAYHKEKVAQGDSDYQKAKDSLQKSAPLMHPVAKS